MTNGRFGAEFTDAEGGDGSGVRVVSGRPRDESCRPDHDH